MVSARFPQPHFPRTSVYSRPLPVFAFPQPQPPAAPGYTAAATAGSPGALPAPPDPGNLKPPGGKSILWPQQPQPLQIVPANQLLQRRASSELKVSLIIRELPSCAGSRPGHGQIRFQGNLQLLRRLPRLAITSDRILRLSSGSAPAASFAGNPPLFPSVCFSSIRISRRGLCSCLMILSQKISLSLFWMPAQSPERKMAFLLPGRQAPRSWFLSIP